MTRYLIAGLGNIGKEYCNTRHNIGFQILDTFTTVESACFESRRYASVAKIRFRGRQLILIKPTTYVNLSGNAVKYWLDKEKIPAENLLVIADDIALPLGILRLRSQGGAGGHNGLSHIIEVLCTNQFPRLRFGIGKEFKKEEQVNYVLGKWTDEENKLLPEKIHCAIEIIKSFAFEGIQQAMNRFNKKKHSEK